MVSGTTSGVEDGQTVTVHLTDGSTTVTTTATVAGGVWTATAADISGLTNGNLTIHRDGADHCKDSLRRGASSSSTRTAVAPVLGFENREKKSPANKPIRRMSRRT